MKWEDTVIKGRVKQDLTIHWTNTITGHLLGWQPTLEPNAQDIFDAWVEEIRQEQAQIAFQAGAKTMFSLIFDDKYIRIHVHQEFCDEFEDKVEELLGD